jgi:hypothetical protein
MENKAPEAHYPNYYIQSSDPVRRLRFWVLMRQQVDLSLALVSVAFLFGLPFDPEDGGCIFPQTFGFYELHDITQDSVLFLRNLFLSDRVV